MTAYDEGGTLPSGVDTVTNATGEPIALAKPAAPLDPSKVKSGDTVTLARNKSTVTGPAHIGMPGAISLHLPGSSIWINNSDRADDPASGGWTLTAHQPAPEPEPEWEPGTVADIEIFGDTELRALSDDVRGVWHAESGDTYRESDEVTNVRPLVVIDPAAVDVESLVDAAIKSAQGKGYWPDQVVGAHMIRHVVAALGIEAPR